MPSGLSYPTTQVNEPGSMLVPGASFSPFLLYDCGCEAPTVALPETSITVEPPAVSTLLAPAPASSSPIDWVVVLIVGGLLLLALGGNQ